MPAATAPSISPGDYAGEMHPVGDPAANPLALRRLWTSVILRLVQDAVTDAHEKSWAKAGRDDCHDAIRWLLNPASEDYRMTCSFAGINGLRLYQDVRAKLGPLAEHYRDKANLLRIQAEVLPKGSAKSKRKAALAYDATAALIEKGLH